MSLMTASESSQRFWSTARPPCCCDEPVLLREEDLLPARIVQLDGAVQPVPPGQRTPRQVDRHHLVGPHRTNEDLAEVRRRQARLSLKEIHAGRRTGADGLRPVEPARLRIDHQQADFAPGFGEAIQAAVEHERRPRGK